LITIISAGGTNNGKAIFLSDLFHFLQFRLPRRDKGCDVFLNVFISYFGHGSTPIGKRDTGKQAGK
jgi:hypothetical protein